MMNRNRPHFVLATLMIVVGIACAATAQENTPPDSAPLFPVRCLYAPGHFGNSYEVMGEHEMRDMLAEAAHWGFNRYGDWFDTIDCADPFADPHYNMGGALWERKKANFRAAQDLGLACDFTITPNHVYLDQCAPDVAATKGGRIFGQLVCPSKPAGRQIILKNYENLFSDLAKAGVSLSGLCPAPYDYGGCACEACAPWIVTFANLCRDIHEVALRHHPNVEMHFIGWWWSDEEHRLFKEWADETAPGWVKSIALHIPYGNTRVSDVPLPEGCERRAFVHIGYAEQAKPRDTYGHLGPVIAATRLEATVNDLAAQGCTGVMAYSEGLLDDVNKALLAGLGSGAHDTSDAVLEAYVQRYFGVAPDDASAVAAWLRTWGKPFDVDALAALAALQALPIAKSRDAWRIKQWELKCALLARHADIMAVNEWTPERMALVDAFWKTQETIHRGVWGLGVPRHALGRRFTPVPWYREWAERRFASHDTLDAEQ